MADNKLVYNIPRVGEIVTGFLIVLLALLAVAITMLTIIVVSGIAAPATLERLRLVTSGILVPVFQSVLPTLIAPSLIKATLTYFDNGQRLRHGQAPERITLFRW